MIQKLPAIIVLCIGIAAIRLGWRGLFHGSIQFTSTKKITGPAAVTLGVIVLLIGFILSSVGFLTLVPKAVEERDFGTAIGVLISTREEVAKVIKAGEERDFGIAPGVKIRMCWIPPGGFGMGSPGGEQGRSDNETQHRVTITKGFWMAKTETTQAQWRTVMGNNPSSFKGDDLPVESVSWNDIAGPGGFIEKANQSGGVGGRFSLPTEAQWEYACRAGTTGAYAGDLDQMAWYQKNSGSKTHPVGSKKPNDWGLCDMHGNVWEWCADGYGAYPGGAITDPRGPASDTGQVIRGGGWRSAVDGCRAATRGTSGPGALGFGFRLARSSVP
jgi:hypothetical protein